MSKPWTLLRDEVANAVASLAAASAHDGDEPRAHVARGMHERLATVGDATELREFAAEWLALYRGGMGSFGDVGTAVMARAVDDLYDHLQAAVGAGD